MEKENFEVDTKTKKRIHSYLLGDSNAKGNSAFLGVDEPSGTIPAYAYFLHKSYGIVLNYQNITIYGKNKRLIKKEFSRLEKLSENC